MKSFFFKILFRVVVLCEIKIEIYWALAFFFSSLAMRM